MYVTTFSFEGRQRVFDTVWKFLGYKSTEDMPNEIRLAWIKFTNRVFNLED